MSTVDIGIGHDDNLVVAAFIKVEFFADACAESGDHGTDFIVGQNLV